MGRGQRAGRLLPRQGCFLLCLPRLGPFPASSVPTASFLPAAFPLQGLRTSASPFSLQTPIPRGPPPGADPSCTCPQAISSSLWFLLVSAVKKQSTSRSILPPPPSVTALIGASRGWVGLTSLPFLCPRVGGKLPSPSVPCRQVSQSGCELLQGWGHHPLRTCFLVLHSGHPLSPASGTS